MGRVSLGDGGEGVGRLSLGDGGEGVGRLSQEPSVSLIPNCESAVIMPLQRKFSCPL